MLNQDVLNVERLLKSFPEEPDIVEAFERIKKELGESLFTVRAKRPVQQRNGKNSSLHL